jgi:hypothetical protein
MLEFEKFGEVADIPYDMGFLASRQALMIMS